MKASELVVTENLHVSHPLDPAQSIRVQQLSNDELLRFGGPSGDDPIGGRRFYHPDDDRTCPGSQIDVSSGHHRIDEIRRRLEQGLLDPGQLVEFALE